MFSAAMDIIRWNIGAYKAIAAAGNARFNLDLDSSPTGATIFYRRVTQQFSQYSRPTNVKDVPFDLAIWYFRFERDGCKPQVLMANPYIETHPGVICGAQVPKEVGKFRSYVALAIVVQTAIFAIPFSAKDRPNFAYLHPPLGDASQFFLPLCLSLVGIASVAPWFIRPKKWAKLTAFIGIGCFIVSLGFYGYFVSATVIKIAISAQNATFFFSVGDTKTELAIATFGPNCEKLKEIRADLGDDCDAAMIKAVNPSDETVRALWTPSSLLKTHVELLCSYLMCLIGVNLFAGATARAYPHIA
jgi:hypothetical protein